MHGPSGRMLVFLEQSTQEPLLLYMQASLDIPIPSTPGALPGATELSRHSSTLGHDLHKQEQASLAIRKEAMAVLDLLLAATLQLDVVDTEALHYVQVSFTAPVLS